MADERRGSTVPARLSRALPADLVAVVVLVVATDLVVLLPLVRESPLAFVLAVPFVLFLPGYAVVSALFPEAGESPTAAAVDAGSDAVDAGLAVGQEGADALVRVPLSVGLSILVTAVVGLALNYTRWGIHVGPVVASLSAFTVVASAVAAVRRRRLPAERRFSVSFGRWPAAVRAELFAPPTRADAMLNVVLVASVALAVGSVGYAALAPAPDEPFTEFYLLTENETGELVAADYPTAFVRGESRPVVVGIANREHEAVSYSVVVELQNATVEENTTVVHGERRLDQFEATLSADETWHRTYDATPTTTGERLRLTFLLYRGAPPANPTANNSYRETHLWITVSAPNGSRERGRAVE